MALQKFGDSSPAEVFRGKEASVVNRHMRRLGKAVSDFDQSEKDQLQAELEEVREAEKPEEAEAPEGSKRSAATRRKVKDEKRDSNDDSNVGSAEVRDGRSADTDSK